MALFILWLSHHLSSGFSLSEISRFITAHSFSYTGLQLNDIDIVKINGRIFFLKNFARKWFLFFVFNN